MKLTALDLFMIKDCAAQELKEAPCRARLSGMKRDLTLEEQRMLAIFKATVTFLNKNGMLKDGVVGGDLVGLEFADSETIPD